jgi:hypothetical protein
MVPGRRGMQELDESSSAGRAVHPLEIPPPDYAGMDSSNIITWHVGWQSCPACTRSCCAVVSFPSLHMYHAFPWAAAFQLHLIQQPPAGLCTWACCSPHCCAAEHISRHCMVGIIQAQCLTAPVTRW